ncbi:PTS sugar transporter subunit IIA [Carboxydothermus pertinax]|uniref:PTS EIIA type-2 domain-containing protein n=1 Tax=Carboxydothermus pertinax TaxID=870242 RepID=A0A1L8CU77_9THEO|nr:fructose PTS transporter subunit IIA [Carboxydothermus pertinax]GAV22451.1 hypothetical protein cpu_09610 [Carboxydothermus pertinax]
MELQNLITNDTILIGLNVSNKEECLYKLVESLYKAGFVFDKKEYFDAVLSREKSGTTGIGFGFAIPHGKSKGVQKVGLAFARLDKPVDWQSLDGKPVEAVFMIAVPEESAGNEHLKILSELARKLMDDKFRNEVLSASSASQVVEILGKL